MRDEQQPARRDTTMDLGPVDLEAGALPVESLRNQSRYVDRVLAEVLQDGVDFGMIAGTSRRTLFQPGAQILCRGLGLSPSFEVASITRGPQLVAAVVRCTLTHYSSGRVVGSGIGSCNTGERKYVKTLATLSDRDEKNNLPPATALELDNTILKMAKKRALVDATLNTTAASRIFAQEYQSEEDPAGDDGYGGSSRPAPRRPQGPPPAKSRAQPQARPQGAPAGGQGQRPQESSARYQGGQTGYAGPQRRGPAPAAATNEEAEPDPFASGASREAALREAAQFLSSCPQAKAEAILHQVGLDQLSDASPDQLRRVLELAST